LIGIPEPDRHRFRDWSRLILAVVANAQPSPEEMAEATGGTVESEGCRGDVVTERRRDPRDDLATRLAFAELDGDQLSDDEIVSNLNVLVGAGFETTVFMLGSRVNARLDHPDQLAVLLGRPDAVKQAIEELLRFEAPVLSPNPRVATVDTLVAGHPIPAGDRIV